MATHDIHRIFVVDGERRLIGVVTALDVIKAIARGETFVIEPAGSGGTVELGSSL
jgi:CBS domain-containing protein